MKKIILVLIVSITFLSCKKGEEINPDKVHPYVIAEPCVKEESKIIVGQSTIIYTYRNYLSKEEGEKVGYYLTVSSSGYIMPSDTSTVFTESTKGVHEITVYHYKKTEEVTFIVNDVDGSKLTTTTSVDVGDTIEWEAF